MTSGKRRLSEESIRANPVSEVHIWKSPASAAVELNITTYLEVYSKIHKHVSSSLPHETGGFLLGSVCLDSRLDAWQIQVKEAVSIDPVEQNPVHFVFTWRDVDKVRSYRESSGLALVGWYHTHPDMGIFLSEVDTEKTHRILFGEPFQVALVYDPIRGKAGYFFWEGPQLIDTTEAEWREFELALQSDEAPRKSTMERQPESVEYDELGDSRQLADEIPEVESSGEEDSPFSHPEPSEEDGYEMVADGLEENSQTALGSSARWKYFLLGVLFVLVTILAGFGGYYLFRLVSESLN